MNRALNSASIDICKSIWASEGAMEALIGKVYCPGTIPRGATIG